MKSQPSADLPAIGQRALHWPGIGLVRRMASRVAADDLPIIAAGVAFYGLLALFPALAAMVAIYGLLLDAQQVSEQVQVLQDVLPDQAMELIVAQLQDLALSRRSSLGLGAAGALALALWGASAVVRTLIKALNVAYDVQEQRSFIKRALVALMLTTGAIVGGVLVIAAVVVLPAMLGWDGLDPTLRGLLNYARWPVVAALVWVGLLIIYRVGPNRRHPRWAWSNPGAALGALFWLAGSAALSWYVENLGNFNSTYGSMGAVVVLLFWFLMSGYAVLLGAELNAELEQGPKRASAASRTVCRD
jgi:membrane protein